MSGEILVKDKNINEILEESQNFNLDEAIKNRNYDQILLSINNIKNEDLDKSIKILEEYLEDEIEITKFVYKATRPKSVSETGMICYTLE